MLEIVLFILMTLADQGMKLWSVNVLQYMPEKLVPVIDNFLYMYYAENHADNVSFIRGRSVFMSVVRVLQIALVLYLLIVQRKRLAKITRIALVMFLAGLVGNQANYILMDYVPDMFLLIPIGRYIFNVADIYVMIAMIIMFVRLAFFEGQDFVDWLLKTDRKAAKGKSDELEKNEPNNRD